MRVALAGLGSGVIITLLLRLGVGEVRQHQACAVHGGRERSMPGPVKLDERSELGRERPILRLAVGTGRTIAVLARMGRHARLMMEHLPFRDRSVPSLISMTSIHELERPVPCVEEMVRVLGAGGVAKARG
jgi:hypothetical protein